MERGLLIADLSESYISLATICAQFGREDIAENSMRAARDLLKNGLPTSLRFGAGQIEYQRLYDSAVDNYNRVARKLETQGTIAELL